MIFNNNYTGVHVIDAIEGIYVGNVNDAKDNNEQVGQKGTLQKLHRNHIEIDRKLLNQSFRSDGKPYLQITQNDCNENKETARMRCR